LKRRGPREILLASSVLVALAMPVVGSAAPAPDAALVTASGCPIFEGEFSQAFRSYAGKGAVRAAARLLPTCQSEAGTTEHQRALLICICRLRCYES
jgi:hypothetical protein